MCTCVRWSLSLEPGQFVFLCFCIFVFVYLDLCICICVFVFLYCVHVSDGCSVCNQVNQKLQPIYNFGSKIQPQLVFYSHSQTCRWYWTNSIKFNFNLVKFNFHLRLADGTEQIQFGDLFRLTESLTNKCVGILQRARKHRLLFTLFTFYLEAYLWSTTEKSHPFWQRGKFLTCELCRLIHFAGDTLWQGEDDQKLVTLIRRNREVQVWLLKTIQEFY